MAPAASEDPVSGLRVGALPSLLTPVVARELGGVSGSRGRQDLVWTRAGTVIGSALSPWLVPQALPSSCCLALSRTPWPAELRHGVWPPALHLEKPRPTGHCELRQTGLAALAGNNEKAPPTSQTRTSGKSSPLA